MRQSVAVEAVPLGTYGVVCGGVGKKGVSLVLASIFIIVVSVVLFVYWFRYTCLLILSAKTAKDYAQDFATANQLAFVEARNRLTSEEATAPVLDDVHNLLERDYRLVVYLLQHAANYQESTEPFENWMLRFDFRLMGLSYRFARSFSSSLARNALLEMAAIVHHMANSMGQRVAVSAGA